MKPVSGGVPEPGRTANHLLATQAQASFKEGLALHKSGHLAQALEIYQQVLEQQPRHFEALYMLGMLAGQTNHPAQALEFIDQAIEINPGYASAHANRGNALNDLKQHQAAVDSYDKAIAIKPEHADAHYNRGIALYELKQYQAAVDSYDRAIAIRPDDAQAYYNRGIALCDLNQFQAAVDSYGKTVAIQPAHAPAHYAAGLALYELKKYQAAVDNYDKAIAILPDYAQAYYNRGIVLHELKQHQAAIDSYTQAIAFRPDDAQAYYNRGLDFCDLNQFQAAVDSYAKAIAIQPAHALAHYAAGVALYNLKKYQAAVDSYDKAIAIHPDYAEAYLNRGAALNDLKQNQAAIESYGKAIAIAPENAAAHWNQSLCYLQIGDLEHGWAKYEWRWKNGEVNANQKRRNFTQPLWSGHESLRGKTILLYSEQGLGDAIQFCRYARLVSDLGARVIFEVERSLLGLLTSLEGVAELAVRGDTLPAFDYQSPLLSLPLAFKTDLTNIPAYRCYIAADPGKVAEWAAKLGTALKPRVGLVWSGSAVHKNDGNRSVPLSDLIKRLPDDFQYVSLQDQLRGADRETLKSHPEILHLEEAIKDFTDTAALCELVDVVISVDTSVAHLAGAMGKQVWIVLPFNPDWRWLLDRSDSPWYPSARLYRQQAIGAWDAVFQAVSTDLRQSFSGL